MAYGLPTWNAGDVLTQANLQMVNDSVSYLLAPNRFNVFDATGTFTSAVTTATNVDTTTTKTLTTYGGPVHIHFEATVHNTGGVAVVIGLSLDGTPVDIITTSHNAANFQARVMFDYLWEPAAGSHNIALQWRVAGASAVMTKTYTPLMFWAIER